MTEKILYELENYFKGNIVFNQCYDNILNTKSKEINRSSAIRLIESWKLYQENNSYFYDFEIALRDYLMLTNQSLTINNYNVSDFGHSIGLREDENGKRILQSYPDYIIQNFAVKAAMAEEIPNEREPLYYLKTNSYIKNLTGFDSFKSEEQKLCVMGALRAPESSSVLVSMSTGGGKSLVTQTIAFQSEGLTIVIVPTVSLMIDQVENARSILKDHASEIDFYNSNTSFAVVQEKLLSKKVKLLFLSPEALIKNMELKQIVSHLNSDGWLKNIIIDEAHIIFEWGDSFRLDFQCIDVLRKRLIGDNPKLRTYLLSATFNQSNVSLLKKFYSVDDNWIELRCDALRREIRYNFIKASSFTDKQHKMVELISKLPHPMIVYVENPYEANRVQQILRDNGINNTNIFTGETVAYDREVLIDKWKSNKFQIMIATCAFGVGVDKKDVRTVLHLYMPDNVNKYYQEAGRGGRDGNSSLSIILYTIEDEKSAFSFICRKILTTEKIKGRWFSMLNGATSKKHGDGTVTMDTSIKPTYADQDNCVTISSTRDIDWNVYVLLLLKRHSMIEIESVDYIDNNYIILVKVLDKGLFKNNEEIEKTISLIREREWADTEKAYRDMIKFLSKCNEQCVSELLLQQYALVPYEFCSGCNSHPYSVLKGTYRGLPIVGHISMNKAVMGRYLINDDVLIIKTDDFDKIENKFIAQGAKTLVLNKFRNMHQNYAQEKDLMIFTLDEFKKIIDNKEFFITNTIVIECPDIDNEIINLLQLIERVKIKYLIRVILLTKENYYIDAFNKRLFEIIEASYKEDYMVK